MLRDSPTTRRRHRRRPAVGGVVACALVAAPLALAAQLGADAPAERHEQVAGRAWVVSPEQGTVSLIDGASHEVVATVAAPGALAGDELAVTQAGSSAYVVDRTLGTAFRVDGATFDVGEPAAVAAPGGRPQVLEGGGAVYLVDPVRRTATHADPRTLEPGLELSLAAEPGEGQSVVDSGGRLWVVDGATGSLTWFDDAKHVIDGLATTESRLVLVEGRAVLVDVTAGRAVELGPDGQEGSWSCTGLPPGSAARLLGSLTSGHVYAAVPDEGTLVISALDRDDCSTAVSLAEPGTADFGPLAQDGRYVFVPDRTTGHTFVVDTVRGEQAADVPLTHPGNRVELTAKDGIVFYNDLDSEVAGVLTLDGGAWTGTPVEKYDAATDEGVAVVGGGDDAPGATEPGDESSVVETTFAPVRDGRSAPDAPTTSVSGGPTISRVDVRPDPVVLGSPVTLTPVVRGAVGSEWEWTVTAPDGTVAWSSDEVGAPTLTLQGEEPASYELTLVVTDADGRRATLVRPLDTVLVPTPHIASFSIDNPSPGLGEVTNISADESGLSGADSTWQWEVSLDGIPLPFPAQPAPGTPLPLQFPFEGVYTVALTITSGELSDSASVPVTYADQCVPALANRRFVDLRESGTTTVDITADDCFVDSTVTLELPAWLSTPTPTVDVTAGVTEVVDDRFRSADATPVPVELSVVGPPPSDGVVTDAVTLVLGDVRVPVDVRVNLPPAWTADPTCTPPDAASGDRPRFHAALADADAGTLDVRLTLDGVPGGPAGGYRMLPGQSGRGTYELTGPATMPVGDATTFSVRATDRFGSVSEVRTVPVEGCAA